MVRNAGSNEVTGQTRTPAARAAAARARLTRRRRPRVAVVLGGGGNLGAIQVGQLQVLCDRGVEPDIVLGCSVGALNGGAFAVDPTPAGLARLRDAWDRIESHGVMASTWMPSALQLVRRGASLSPSDGLRRTIVELLGHRERFDELALEFQCVATDVDRGTEHWFTSGDLVTAVLASAALPAVYPMVELDGHRYLDGGVVNNVPLSRAVELGARKIYVCHVGPHGRPNPEVKRPLDAALIAYWIARNSRFARDLAAVPRGIEVVVLPPGRRPDLRYDDFGQTAALVEQGRRNAEEYLAQLDRADEGDGTPSRTERLADDLMRLVDELRGKFAERSRADQPEAGALSGSSGSPAVDPDGPSESGPPYTADP